jgi:VWFA-related protein
MTSIRFAAVLLAAFAVTRAAPGNSSELSADQAKVLDSAREYAMQYTAKLPNFICTQVTKRDTARANTRQVLDSGIGGAYYGASDEIVEKVSFFKQMESYEIVSINNKKVAGLQHNELAGARSAGEFGSALRVIFDPKTHTTFSGHRMGEVRGRQAYVFEFKVPKETGIPVSTANSSAPTLVAYHGLIFFDAATNEVLRVTTNFDFPKGFPIQQAYRLVDYDSVSIAGRRYNLPARAEIRMQSSADSFLNKIEFKDYREFAVQSTIRFGMLEKPAGTSPATPGNQAAPAAPAEVAQSPQTSRAADAGEPAPQTPEIASNTHAGTPPPVAATSEPASSAQSVQQGTRSTTQAVVAVNIAPVPQPADTKMEPRPAHEAAPQLRLNTDLVLIPVVVRDASGHAKTNLRKEDFQIFDKGKRQEIASFAVEQLDGQAAINSTSSGAPAVVQKPSTGGRATPNYFVYLFDDIHLREEELIRAREAARQSVEALPATDLAAIVTTSGLVQSPMATDREKFKEALLKLRAEPLGGTSAKSCPDIDAYMASEILGQRGAINSVLLGLTTSDALRCMKLPPGSAGFAQNLVLGLARDAIMMGEQQTHQWLAQLRDVVRWVGKAPGRRNIILISPGFVPVNSAQMEGADIVDEAIRTEVTISAIDARGVYGENPAGAIEDKASDPDSARMKSQIMYAEATASADVLGEMAGGTGGNFVRNTNNLNAGLKALATPPECIYVLGFKPEKLKLDGSVHPIVVKVNTKEKLDVQARRGYVAANR